MDYSSSIRPYCYSPGQEVELYDVQSLCCAPEISYSDVKQVAGHDIVLRERSSSSSLRQFN